MTVNTAFGVSTPVNSRSINNAFDSVLNGGYDFSNIVATGSITAATFSGSGASLTALNASNLSSGTVPSARISGSYTGITGVGTLTVGAIPASLLTGTTLPASIVTSSLTSVGTITSGTWSGSFGAVSGANLTSLNASNLASGTVPGGRVSGSYTGITGVGTLTALTVSAQMSVSGISGGYGFLDRSGTGEGFVWYSTSADAYLYSNRLGANMLGFARTTGQMYVYYGVNGSPLYGSYGSFNIYGSSGGWGGITFPDFTSTMMVQNTIFGHYRNNTTWNFYVQNGTYVPSDARYKRDIQPLENGLDFIRHIAPVSYDPLTENPDDDPETTVGRTHYGFTTQNVLEALELSGETRDVAVVDIGGPDSSMGGDRQYLNHSALIAPMVKAIQELDARLQQLETA
jgi:hypothetical protein